MRLGRGRAFPPKIVRLNPLTLTSTVALTGVAATSAVAAFGKSITNTLTGVSASAGVASFVPKAQPVLASVAATAAAASFRTSVSKTLTGVQAVSGVAAFKASLLNSLTGVQATAGVGSFFVPISRSVFLTAVAATAHAGTITATSGGQPQPNVLGGTKKKRRRVVVKGKTKLPKFGADGVVNIEEPQTSGNVGARLGVVLSLSARADVGNVATASASAPMFSARAKGIASAHLAMRTNFVIGARAKARFDHFTEEDLAEIAPWLVAA